MADKKLQDLNNTRVSVVSGDQFAIGGADGFTYKANLNILQSFLLENSLTTSTVTAPQSAVVKAAIDFIEAILQTDNATLDDFQKITDAIEAIQTTLSVDDANYDTLQEIVDKLKVAETNIISLTTDKQDVSEKGIADGYASLNATGKVPASQLPAYVDSVEEYANLASFPATGTSGVIYVAQDTNLTYRWSGSTYVKLNDVDFTDYLNKITDTLDDVAAGTTNKHFTATEKTKLANIADGAEVNVQPDWNQTDNTNDAFIQNKPTLGTASGKNVGTAIGDIQENGAALGNSQTVETDATGKFITAAKNTAYNANFGTGTNDVARGDASYLKAETYTQTEINNALDLKEDIANKGVAGGYASLNGSGLVPASQLPSYVDDVEEYANLAAFPATGSDSKLYVALDTNFIYRWSGTTYVRVNETNLNDYFNKVTNTLDDVAAGTTNLHFTAAIQTDIDNKLTKSQNLLDVASRQFAINNITDSTNSTIGDVLTVDIAGNAVFATPTGGGGGTSVDVFFFAVDENNILNIYSDVVGEVPEHEAYMTLPDTANITFTNSKLTITY
jgi:hypothetical protein